VWRGDDEAMTSRRPRLEISVEKSTRFARVFGRAPG